MKKLLFAVLITYATIGFYSCTSEHVVSDQPVAVTEVEGTAPGSNYVWVNSEYAWSGGRYVVVPGRWAIGPHEGAAWIPGHWNHVTRGYVWVRGHWN
jgi:hypothetical protein